MLSKFKTRLLFCDWHMPDFLPEIRIDYDDYFKHVKETGAQSLIFMAKSAHGNCLFPSKVGTANKAMKGDIFGEIARRTKEMGLQFIAYYNVVANRELISFHPDWQQLDRTFKPAKVCFCPAFCMSNENFKEYFCRHMAEIAENYDIDGFFLDLQYFSQDGCFCDSCKEKFKNMFSYELEPEKFSTTNHWLDFYTMQAQVREDFIHSGMERCNAIKQGLIWSWNGSGNPQSISSTLGERADFVSTEAHPPGYLQADYRSRFCQGIGKRFTLFMPESQGSWGDWTLNTVDTMKGLSAIALAHGGSLNINHVPYPCGDYAGKVPIPVWNSITETFRWVKEREQFCIGKKSVPVAACLHSTENVKLMSAIWRSPKGQELATRGLHLRSEIANCEQMAIQIFLESHIPLDIRPAESSLDSLNKYELLILAHIPYVNEELKLKLRDYVENGGNLIASFNTSLLDEAGNIRDNFSLSDMFGVDFVKESDYSVSYLDRLDSIFSSSVPDMPLLLKDAEGGERNPKNHVFYCTPHPGTKVLGYITDPVIESDFEKGYHVYHDHAPPAKCTNYPGIVLNRFGKGKVIFLPVPFFKAYMSKKSPFLKEILRTLIVKELGVSQKIQIEAPVSVKAVLMQDEDGWLLHLIHIQKETDSMYLENFERCDPIRVRVCPGWGVSSVQKCLDGKKICFEAKNQWTEFVLPMIVDHEIIRIST